MGIIQMNGILYPYGYTREITIVITRLQVLSGIRPF